MLLHSLSSDDSRCGGSRLLVAFDWYNNDDVDGDECMSARFLRRPQFLHLSNQSRSFVGIDTIHSLKVRGKQCSISEEAKLKTEQEKVSSIAVSR